MPTVKEKVAIVISSGLLATGLVTAFQPPAQSDPAQRDAQPRQQQVGELSDAQDAVNSQLRDDADAHLDAENAKALIPGEYRPIRPPRLRFYELP